MNNKNFSILGWDFLIYMIAVLVIVCLVGTGAAVSLSNSGGGTWKYQRDISIKENSGTTLTDYQVLIELKEADFPVEAKSDGADIRFTDSNGNELNYWIENWNYAGKNAKIWVKVPSISMSAVSMIRTYYGNPTSTSSSNGDMTFEFFDSFSGTTIDSTKLNVVGSGISQNNELLINVDSPSWGHYVYSKNTFAAPLVIDAKIQTSFSSATYWVGGLSYGNVETAENDYHIAFTSASSGGPIAFRFGKNQASWYPSAIAETTYSTNTYYLATLRILPSGAEALKDGVQIGSKDISQSLSNLNIFLDNTYALFKVDDLRVRKYSSSEPTITLAPPKSSSLTITKSASPYSFRQFQESTIKVLIENSGTSEVRAIEIMDSIHPSFDLTGGDFPNPKKFDSIRAGESRELQYTIKSKESGAFTLDSATVTYADSEGNIQEVKSEPVSIKVVPSSDGTSSGMNTGQNSKSASVSLYGEKTDVVLGENVLLKLSAINIIGNPIMHVQVIIIPPNGWSVISSAFSKSGAGQYTTIYDLKPEDGVRDIEVQIMPNQIGDNFEVKGRIVFYFGDDLSTKEDHPLSLPIKVRKEIASTSDSIQKPAEKSSGFEIILAGVGMILALSFRRR
jgi:hypothetical protein